MKILAVETSSKVCAVALLEDKTLIKEEIIEDENTHSEKLMPLIDKVLQETNIKLDEIDLFAVDKGPGSFTGIRIGVATIKAFMDAKNIPGIGITSLECLAYNVEKDGLICSIIDARNDNVYYGVFEKKDKRIVKCLEQDFSNINDLVEKLDYLDKDIILVGSGAQEHKKYIQDVLKEKAEFILDEDLNKLNARNIAISAYYNREQAGDSNSIVLSYLRKSNAER